MNTKEYIEKAEETLLHTYNRYPVVFEKGEGVYLYDTDGNKYLDFASGIGVMGLGYGNKEYTDALKDQAGKLLHTSNLFYSDVTASAAMRVTRASGMDRVFFTNSGTEAVEGAIKAAKKYAYDKDGTTDHEIIAFNSSFHGRSLGALSVTGKESYRAPFEGLIPGIRFADFNDISSVRALVNEKTCAVIVEVVQGEGGIHKASREFMEGLEALRREHGLLLVFDEIQCGMGRTGKMFAYQHYNVKPDIVTMAKALGCGVPVGCFALTEDVAAHSLVPGDHGSTYGGNPFVLRAVDKVLEIMEREDVPGHAHEAAQYLTGELDKLKNKYNFIEEIRGLGLMAGIKLSDTLKAGDIVNDARDEGLIIITAEENVLRLLPPLIIQKEDVDKAVSVLDKVFSLK